MPAELRWLSSPCFGFPHADAVGNPRLACLSSWPFSQARALAVGEAGASAEVVGAAEAEVVEAAEIPGRPPEPIHSLLRELAIPR
jgi:hypothetical protein